MYFFFSSRRRHTRWPRDWSSDVCSSDLKLIGSYKSDRRGDIKCCMSSTVVIFRCCSNCKTVEDNCIDSSCIAGLKACFSLKYHFVLLANINSPLTLLVYKIIVRGAIEPVYVTIVSCFQLEIG